MTLPARTTIADQVWRVTYKRAHLAIIVTPEQVEPVITVTLLHEDHRVSQIDTPKTTGRFGIGEPDSGDGVIEALCDILPELRAAHIALGGSGSGACVQHTDARACESNE